MQKECYNSLCNLRQSLDPTSKKNNDRNLNSVDSVIAEVNMTLKKDCFTNLDAHRNLIGKLIEKITAVLAKFTPIKRRRIQACRLFKDVYHRDSTVRGSLTDDGISMLQVRNSTVGGG